jgi:hypothetical protein
MPTHDILARVSAVLSIFAAMWNGVVAILYVAMLIWFLVGALWFIPLFLAVVEGIAAVAILVVGFKKPNIAVPALGLFISLCCFNFIGMMLEVLSLGLQIGAFMSYNAEQQDPIEDAPTAEADLVLVA